MKGNKFEKVFLRVMLVITIGIIPYLLRKSPVKDWILVYLLNGLTNVIIDKFMVSYKILKYPVRFFPKTFDINLLFDMLLYPIMTITYNQTTKNSSPFTIF